MFRPLLTLQVEHNGEKDLARRRAASRDRDDAGRARPVASHLRAVVGSRVGLPLEVFVWTRRLSWVCALPRSARLELRNVPYGI